MASNLRQLLIVRAARLQERPALAAPDWGTLSYFRWRNRVEGVALGLMASPPRTALFAATGSAWDWACEVAAACCGLRWDPAAPPAPEAVLGGSAFNAEGGRQAYHDGEAVLGPGTPFAPHLTHGELLGRLQRLNGRLGWDHETRFRLPLEALGSRPGRAALWSALYAGACAELVPGQAREWDPAPFEGLL